MSYPINYPTPQGANVQIFNTPSVNANPTSTWIKPQGASFVWFTLIGGGGAGDGSAGGGSGAVTNCMVPAFLIPDSLVVDVGAGGIAGNSGTASQVFYKQKDGTGYQLLIAQPGNPGGTGGAAMSSNYFSCMGFFQSVTGQSGGSGNIAASTTTFLSGGGGSSATVTANYGYTCVTSPGNNSKGQFYTQPIIVGVGGADNAKAGLGCGGGYNGATGGDGLVVIITW
jgi:hypothetical protein